MAALPFAVSRARPEPGQPVLARAPKENLLGDVGQALGQFAEQQITLRRQSDLSGMTLEASKRLADLELEFEKDTDYRTAPARFQQKSQQIMAEIGAMSSDKTVQAAFSRDYQRLALAKGVNVKKGAWIKEKDAEQAKLDDAIETYSTLYANASNPVEKNLIKAQADQTILGAGEAGWITREEAGKRNRTFSSRATEAEIAKLGRNPANAEAIVQKLIAGDFKDLDPVARERNIRTWQARADAHDRKAIAYSERADRQAAKQMKIESEAAEKDFMVKAMTGSLSVEEVLKKQNVMEPNAFKAALTMARAGDGVTDRAIDVDLTNRVGKEDISKDAARAFNAGALSQPRYNALMEDNRRALQDTRPGAPFKTLRTNIDGRLKPSELNYSPVQAKLQQDGLREWDDWNRANPEANKEQMDDKADEIIRRYSQIQVGEMAAATALPRYYGKDRAAITQRPQEALAALEAAGKKVLEDLDAGKITQAQAAREARDIQILEEAAQRSLILQNDDKKKVKK